MYEILTDEKRCNEAPITEEIKTKQKKHWMLTPPKP